MEGDGETDAAESVCVCVCVWPLQSSLHCLEPCWLHKPLDLP